MAGGYRPWQGGNQARHRVMASNDLLLPKAPQRGVAEQAAQRPASILTRV